MNPKKLPLLVLLTLIGILLACGAPPLVTGDETPSAAARTAVQPTEERTAPRSPTTPGAATAATYYVRPDGGDATQCTGLADAPYPGSGTGQDCAWDHPFRALPPAGPPRIAGGDTLIIAAGAYMVGYGAPEANLEDDVCARDYPGDCHMSPVPSGSDPAHPTRILGAGWDSGCPVPPQLWGTQRADLILNLTDASNVEVACLEITDHSACVEFHGDPSLACERDAYPYGEWAAAGLYAEDSANVHLWDLDVHGLASAGVHAGRLTDWTIENVRIAGNGLVGWDGDLWEGSDSNSGTLTFLFYQEGCPGLEFDSDYSIYHSVKLSLYVAGSHDVAAEPQLSGPFTGTAYGMALAAGSPAIDAGDNAFCPSTDIRGVARPVDGGDDGVAVCDMGAYEYRVFEGGYP